MIWDDFDIQMIQNHHQSRESTIRVDIGPIRIYFQVYFAFIDEIESRFIVEWVSQERSFENCPGVKSILSDSS